MPSARRPIGGAARVKRIYGVDLQDPSVTWRTHGEPLGTVAKRLLRDVLEDLDARSITVPDKLEGAGVTADGRLFLATDNDGVEENRGAVLQGAAGHWACPASGLSSIRRSEVSMKVVHCECGLDVEAESDDELVAKVEEHVRAEHPDLVGKMSREQVLGMAHEH